MKLFIYFDYTCPFCYIGIKQLKHVLRAYGNVEPVWRPFELHPKPTDREDIVPDPYSGELWAPGLLEEAEKEGLLLKTPVTPYPYTNIAFQGMHYVATIGGNIMAYNDRIFKAVFEDGLDISDLSVLTGIAGSLDIDETGFNNAVSDKLLRRKQEKALKHAYFKSGVEEVPTYIAAGLRISGAIGREALKQFLEDALEEEKRIIASRIGEGK